MTMVPQSRKARLLWLAIPVLGAGTLYGVLASRDGRDSAVAPARPDAKPAAVKGDPSRLAEAIKLGGDRGTTATDRIVARYAEWASDPSAVPERKLLLSSLFAEQEVAKKLSGVLAAVEADPTPPEKDPLWNDIARSLADLWKGDTATGGMDLVVAEKRPRARRALISSFAVLASSPGLQELTSTQRQTLTETMIDLAWYVPQTQKPEVTEALRKLGGNDLAAIYEGKGVTGKDGHVLESEVAYQNALAETSAQVAAGEMPGQ
jgi:hypothetical protein